MTQKRCDEQRTVESVLWADYNSLKSVDKSTMNAQDVDFLLTEYADLKGKIKELEQILAEYTKRKDSIRDFFHQGLSKDEGKVKEEKQAEVFTQSADGQATPPTSEADDETSKTPDYVQARATASGPSLYKVPAAEAKSSGEAEIRLNKEWNRLQENMERYRRRSKYSPVSTTKAFENWRPNA